MCADGSRPTPTPPIAFGSQLTNQPQHSIDRPPAAFERAPARIGSGPPSTARATLGYYTMDDVEIVVNARKGVDEQKALKVLAKFLKRDQEKDVDEQVRSGWPPPHPSIPQNPQPPPHPKNTAPRGRAPPAAAGPGQLGREGGGAPAAVDHPVVHVPGVAIAAARGRRRRRGRGRSSRRARARAGTGATKKREEAQEEAAQKGVNKAME